MSLPTDWGLVDPQMALALVGGLFMMAVLGVILTFKLIELNWGFGVVGSIVLGIALLAGIWKLGGPYWNPSYAAFEQGVFLGLAGLISGFVFAVTMFEPETGTDTATQESDEESFFSPRGRSSGESTEIPGGLEDLDNQED